MDNLYKEELALEEVRLLYQKFDADANQLDAKAANLLSSSSLILTLFGVLQISLLTSSQPVIYVVLIILSLLFFIGVVCIILIALFPRGYKTVFKEDWEGVENAILHKETEQDAIMQMIGNYLDRIKGFKEINAKKAFWLRIATILFVLMILTIILSSLAAVR